MTPRPRRGDRGNDDAPVPGDWRAITTFRERASPAGAARPHPGRRINSTRAPAKDSPATTIPRRPSRVTSPPHAPNLRPPARPVQHERTSPRELIEPAGAEPELLPPYRPDLNPNTGIFSSTVPRSARVTPVWVEPWRMTVCGLDHFTRSAPSHGQFRTQTCTLQRSQR